MSGPYCKTCVHFAPMPFSEKWGECMDSSKIIFSGGNNITSAPEVAPFYYCSNHTSGVKKVILNFEGEMHELANEMTNETVA
jgi:hypothetical protein